MKIIDGRKRADEILAGLKKEIKDKNLRPGLGIILVGAEPSSCLYVKVKETAAKKIGVRVRKQILSGRAPESEILEVIESFNRDAQIDGILVQLPLPKEIPTDKIIRSIEPNKDVDGFLPESRFDSPFIAAIWQALKVSGENLKGKKILALVKSDIFGQRLTGFLSRKGLCCDYTICQKPQDCPAALKIADIVITALGQPGFINAAMVNDGAVLIDGGTTRQGDKTIGDIDAESVSRKAKWLAPSPGGVGPITVALLLRNVVLACPLGAGRKRAAGVK
ncbi:MAG: bifunctional methylenetetrahydrofolate dehydrogenase/methenyltetrahydrofolate cyclohydrolase [Candidatus Portnoybacteria bacterium CG_4_8_14_3_um_filter_44_15]|uniref:Bifunctional protein FolD n=4 Tax=Candidatus Portnoyibacteriota TaxID=1817913 RepID=A0A2M7YMF8_9BACT|nr:MAG: hypothetical protein AUJ11_00215 [Parcubacteria group bacterium CG1_02_44_65]PIW74916.1 MAG: bifunctional methylenetetrahydrofolate dehydrogenase/methenyltetrahydrofolate cyclohydrolase [Candidatus Portnoybacteria bacterium CG_4_8_14_3_um_filter_44_15]PJA64136.1 MAG: bifunctional methylenetetrahydrofolate dehydrogenase/methenyltetrahydrofolate cyclohydrolase [Candidatus Portnoybacteria bacterium CG_4_9_14_3_um_filter_43_11]PJE59403.1 MAG: bifunctional methylenetetrahydrofolate dehydrogen